MKAVDHGGEGVDVTVQGKSLLYCVSDYIAKRSKAPPVVPLYNKQTIICCYLHWTWWYYYYENYTAMHLL